MFRSCLWCIQIVQIAPLLAHCLHLKSLTAHSLSVHLYVPCSPLYAAQPSAVCLWDTVCQANLPAFHVGANKQRGEGRRHGEGGWERERGRGERARVWKWGRQLQSLAGREKHGQGSVCAECRRLFLLLFWKEIYVFGRQNCQKTFSLVHPARLSWSWRLLDWPYDYTRCYSWSGNCSPSASEVELSKEEQRQGSVREERALRVGASPPPTLLHHQLDGGPGVLRLLLL